MAEGGVEEMAKAYQTVTEKMCELCLDEDSFKQATWYCKQCKQRLCDKCRKYHRKVASAKDHEVVRAEEISPVVPQSTEELSDELRTPMCSTHNLPIELYCDDHKQPVCYSCKLVDHRKCQHLRDLERVVKDNRDRSSELLQHLEDIGLGLSKTQNAMTKESQAVGEQKKHVIKNIKDQIQQIEALGYKKISEAEKLFEKEENSIQKEKKCIQQTQLLVSESIDEIKTAKQTGSEEELFLATSHAENEAGKYQDILNDTSHITKREVDFNDTIRLKDIESFWNIEFKKCTVDVDLQPRSFEYLNTKTSKKIYWIDILQEEQVILLIRDETQHGDHLSLYSRSAGLLSQLDMPANATSADTLNDHQVIVAIPIEQRLITVNIVSNKLLQKHIIQTKGFSLLILKYSEQSVLAFVQDVDLKIFFKISDFKGNVLTEIPIKENLVCPSFMKMSNDKSIIYINDIRNGCYGFNLKGDTLFHYTQTDAKQYAGLAVDHNNCVYLRIDDQQGKHLTKLSPAGQRIQSICRDYGWPMKCDMNKMYLVYLTNVNNEKAICYIYV